MSFRTVVGPESVGGPGKGSQKRGRQGVRGSTPIYQHRYTHQHPVYSPIAGAKRPSSKPRVLGRPAFSISQANLACHKGTMRALRAGILGLIPTHRRLCLFSERVSFILGMDYPARYRDTKGNQVNKKVSVGHTMRVSIFSRYTLLWRCHVGSEQENSWSVSAACEPNKQAGSSLALWTSVSSQVDKPRFDKGTSKGTRSTVNTTQSSVGGTLTGHNAGGGAFDAPPSFCSFQPRRRALGSGPGGGGNRS